MSAKRRFMDWVRRPRTASGRPSGAFGAGRPARGAGRASNGSSRPTGPTVVPARDTQHAPTAVLPPDPRYPASPSPCPCAPRLVILAASSSRPRAARERARAGRQPGAAERATPAPPQPPPAAAELVVERPGGKPLIREGQVEPPAARRHLVLPPGRHARRATPSAGSPSATWSAGRAITVPHNWNAHRHARSTSRRSAGTARSSSCRARRRTRRNAALEGALRGLQLPHEGVAERQGDRRPDRLLPVRGRPHGPAQGAQHARGQVSSLRSSTDLTHWRPAAFNGYGTGGWWNFGGLLREVYVRQVDTIDVEDVQVLPRLRSCAARPRSRSARMVRNLDPQATAT